MWLAHAVFYMSVATEKVLAHNRPGITAARYAG